MSSIDQAEKAKLAAEKVQKEEELRNLLKDNNFKQKLVMYADKIPADTNKSYVMRINGKLYKIRHLG